MSRLITELINLFEIMEEEALEKYTNATHCETELDMAYFQGKKDMVRMCTAILRNQGLDKQ